MKIFLVIAAALSLVSCNTSIGLWRDTKLGFQWTKAKMQGSSGGGGDYVEPDPSGAPVY